MSFGKMVAVVLLVSLCTGCATDAGQQEQTGMIIGGVLGGVLGSQVGGGHGRDAAIVAGALAGAAIGSSIGHSMDKLDRQHTAQTLETVRTGVQPSWKNPDSKIEYRVVPTRTYDGASGPCREYTIDAMIGGKQEQVRGDACRTADGSWAVKQ